MVLELLSGGEFFSYLQSCGRLPEEVARFYSASVLCAFEELHRHLIAYRDLKPENMVTTRVALRSSSTHPSHPHIHLTHISNRLPLQVLDCRGYVKLVDLGLAKQIVDGTTW
jgi:serine/threonine protein kinase